MVHEFHGSLLVPAVAPRLIFVLRGRLGWLALMFSILIFRYVKSIYDAVSRRHRNRLFLALGIQILMRPASRQFC